MLRSLQGFDALSYVKYSYEGISLNELSGLVITCTPEQLAKAGGTCPITSGQQVGARPLLLPDQACGPSPPSPSQAPDVVLPSSRPPWLPHGAHADPAPRPPLKGRGPSPTTTPALQTIDTLGLDYITMWGAGLTLVGYIAVCRTIAYLGVRWCKW
jgi:hypothetical protein